MALLNFFKKKKDQGVLDAAVKSQAEEVKIVEKENKKEKKEITIKSKKTISEAADRIIVRPYITEKSAILAHVNQYVFVVHPEANQIQIRNAIKELYGVLPVRVNVQNQAGKAVRFGRIRGKRKAWKKAVVTLPSGSRIDVYEGV